MKKLSFININKIWLFAIITILSSVLYSCKKNFLDVDPQGEEEAGQFFTTEQDAIQSVTSIYGNLNTWEECGFPWLAIMSIPSDDADKGSSPGDAGFLDEFDNFTMSPTQFLIDLFWKGQYAGINLSNQCIQNIPAIPMNEGLKNRLIAEAKFLRAYHYFNLVRAFGDVPRVIKIPETETELNPFRVSKNEIYLLIEQDLTEAAANLPLSYSGSDVGRATSGSAIAMLTKVNMYQKNWGAAVSNAERVINAGYTLVNDYQQIYRLENNSESIFEVQTEDDVRCGLTDNWTNIQAVRGQWGWGLNTPSEDLNNAYEAGDTRREGTILYKGETTPQGDKVTDFASNPRYNQKAYQPTSIPITCGADPKEVNRKVLRLGEIYLIHAEACNETSQPDKALISLNLVRARAGLGPVTNKDQNQLRDIIWKERRVEMAMEEDRFFDLVRQGRAGTVLRAAGKQFVDGKNEVFPIPQNQITLSGGRLTQNPGY